MAKPLPAIFFGHGNPMNAVALNAYTEAWRRIGEALPRPRAILSVSAHWFVPGTSNFDLRETTNQPRVYGLRLSYRFNQRAQGSGD